MARLGMKRKEGEIKHVFFPYLIDTNGEMTNRISIPACKWIIDHVLEADYQFGDGHGKDNGLTVVGTTDGTPPPDEETEKLVADEEYFVVKRETEIVEEPDESEYTQAEGKRQNPLVLPDTFQDTFPDRLKKRSLKKKRA